VRPRFAGTRPRNSGRNRFVTISVDDGHPSDFRTAELLHKYQLKATFYLPRRNPERQVMSEHEIAEISHCYEIGGHTLNNLRLKRVPETLAWKEVNECKHWLQDVIGAEVTSFCYPGGKFDPRIVALVRRAGYLGARTCMFNRHEFPRDPFLFGVSTHACRHSTTIQIRHALLEANLRGAWNYVTVYRRTVDWKLQFLLSLDFVERHGGVAHLFLHSWEIEANREWLKLESIFREISERRTLTRVSNGDLFRSFQR
jgi:peptidoglycan/xylan/chitin deacetylase (PgdA/CDA1 family)